MTAPQARRMLIAAAENNELETSLEVTRRESESDGDGGRGGEAGAGRTHVFNVDSPLRIAESRTPTPITRSSSDEPTTCHVSVPRQQSIDA